MTTGSARAGGEGRLAVAPARREQHRPVVLVELRRPGFDAGLDGHAECLAFGSEPLDQPRQALSSRRRRSGDQRAAEVVAALEDPDREPVERRDTGRLEASGSAADDQELAGTRSGRRGRHGCVLALVAGGRLDHAAHDRVAHVEHLAALVAQDAGADTPRGPAGELSPELRIGDLGPRHLDEIRGAVGEPRCCRRRVDDRSLGRERRRAWAGERHARTVRASSPFNPSGWCMSGREAAGA